MMSDIAQDSKFKGILEENKFFDLETPYGYGGPLYDFTITEQSKLCFMKQMTAYAVETGIISQFVRFHPLLMNHETAKGIFETRYLHDTVYIDTRSEDTIVKNMDSKNRNMIRKAIKNGVQIIRKDISEYHDFLPIYKETMIKDKATDYYFFDEDYFKAQMNLKDNACFLYAVQEGKPIAGAIMYYNDKFMHYHLAGTHTVYRKFAPSNLLLYEAACWANKVGIEKFHLGGGMSQEDNLFGFKKQFNKNGRLPFVIGRTVFDENKYNELLQLRKKADDLFDVNNTRMIQYRA